MLHGKCILTAYEYFEVEFRSVDCLFLFIPALKSADAHSPINNDILACNIRGFFHC